MGRSVMTLADSIVAYQTIEPDFDSEKELFESEIDEGFIDPDTDFEWWVWDRWNAYGGQDTFEWMLEDTLARVQEMFPSMKPADYWIDRELHVIAENSHSIVTVSEYCGMVAICLGDNYDRENYWYNDAPTHNLGVKWREQVQDKFLTVFSEFNKLGTFSDGTSVYEKTGA